MQVVVYHLGFSLNIDFVFSPSILTNQIQAKYLRTYPTFSGLFFIGPNFMDEWAKKDSFQPPFSDK